MSLDEILFSIYLVIMGVFGINGTIRGVQLVFGWARDSADKPRPVRCFFLIRNLIELGFLYLVYQLFAKDIMEPLPIFLIGMLFGLVLIGVSFLVGKYFRKEGVDFRYPF
jgi:hypothetical protein